MVNFIQIHRRIDKQIIVNSPMETNIKETYEAPTMMVVAVKTEGMICASKDQYEPIPF